MNALVKSKRFSVQPNKIVTRFIAPNTKSDKVALNSVVGRDWEIRNIFPYAFETQFSLTYLSPDESSLGDHISSAGFIVFTSPKIRHSTAFIFCIAIITSATLMALFYQRQKPNAMPYHSLIYIHLSRLTVAVLISQLEF